MHIAGPPIPLTAAPHRPLPPPPPQALQESADMMRRSASLSAEWLPLKVRQRLEAGLPVLPERYGEVSILFLDICGCVREEPPSFRRTFLPRSPLSVAATTLPRSLAPPALRAPSPAGMGARSDDAARAAGSRACRQPCRRRESLPC